MVATDLSVDQFLSLMEEKGSDAKISTSKVDWEKALDVARLTFAGRTFTANDFYFFVVKGAVTPQRSRSKLNEFAAKGIINRVPHAGKYYYLFPTPSIQK